MKRELNSPDWKPPIHKTINIRYKDQPIDNGERIVCGECEGYLVQSCHCDRMYCKGCVHYCRDDNNKDCPQAYVTI